VGNGVQVPAEPYVAMPDVKSPDGHTRPGLYGNSWKGDGAPLVVVGAQAYALLAPVEMQDCDYKS